MCSDHGCEYRQQVGELTQQVGELGSQISQKDQRIAELEAELAKYQGPPKDSGNSSNPPSKDQNRNRYPQREKSGKKPGGQPGHTGHNHPFSETPDTTVQCAVPQECQYCHSRDLTQIESGEKRQVVDIPEPKFEVTQYEQTQEYCNVCGKVSKSQFPKGVDAYVRIGERAQS